MVSDLNISNFDENRVIFWSWIEWLKIFKQCFTWFKNDHYQRMRLWQTFWFMFETLAILTIFPKTNTFYKPCEIWISQKIWSNPWSLLETNLILLVKVTGITSGTCNFFWELKKDLLYKPMLENLEFLTSKQL